MHRLVAIVHADLAGFTRLMEGAETRTFRHLEAAQNEVRRPTIEAGGGWLVGGIPRSARRDGAAHRLRPCRRPCTARHVAPGGVDSLWPAPYLRGRGRQAAERVAAGRGTEQCDLVVAHAPVSRWHARLSLVGDTLRIEDLGSTNGTSVDGKPVRPGFPMAAEPGSTIRLGDVKLSVQQD